MPRLNTRDDPELTKGMAPWQVEALKAIISDEEILIRVAPPIHSGRAMMGEFSDFFALAEALSHAMRDEGIEKPDFVAVKREYDSDVLAAILDSYLAISSSQAASSPYSSVR